MLSKTGRGFANIGWSVGRLPVPVARWSLNAHIFFVIHRNLAYDTSLKSAFEDLSNDMKDAMVWWQISYPEWNINFAWQFFGWEANRRRIDGRYSCARQSLNAHIFFVTYQNHTYDTSLESSINDLSDDMQYSILGMLVRWSVGPSRLPTRLAGDFPDRLARRFAR